MNGLIGLLLLVFLTSTQPAIAGYSPGYPDDIRLWAQATPNHAPDELLVSFQNGVPLSRINAINGSLNTQIISTLLPGRLYLIKIPTGRTLEEIRQAYASLPDVKSVDLNYLIRPE